MTDEYNITDEEINEVTAKMEDQFAKLGEFLDDRTPEEKLEVINKQVEQLQQEKYKHQLSPTQRKNLAKYL